MLTLYRDDHLLAANKPAGMPVHGSAMLADRPPTLLRRMRSETGRVVHPAHRLDRPVSGALLMAFDGDTLRAMGQAFEQRRVLKRYLAVVRGWTPEEDTVDYPLWGKPARTRYRRIATAEVPVAVGPYPGARYSLLLLSPETGRRHQLRRHMKHISHHLVGDTTYGRGEHNQLFREHLDSDRLLLHAWTLEFDHPQDGRPMRIVAPPGPDFGPVLQRLGWGGDFARLEEGIG